MKKIFAGLLSVGLLMSACDKNAPQEGEAQEGEGFAKAKGGRIYGGTFKLNESEYIKSLFPLNILDSYSYRVACQIYEGLFKFDQKTLKVKNGLAESYTLDETGLVYTIKLKKGVFFHDDPAFPDNKGKEFKADDVMYCFKKICTKSKLNQSFHLFSGMVKGADEFYAASEDPANFDKPLEGLQKVDDYTITLTLTKPSSVFLYNLSRPGAFIYAKEAVEKYQEEMRVKCVGTGPFKLGNVEDDISIMLTKNKNYHGVDEYGNKLPFLEGISVQFLKEKKVELLEFKKGKLDMMYRLPTDHIIDILEDSETDSEGSYSQYELQRAPEMSTQFLAFQNQKGVFKDINVRKAFSFAIDREKILEYVLNGEGYAPGRNGFTPPSFEDYDINKINGYTFNLDSARIYLAKAGFANGKNFPKINLDFNPEGARHTNVAVEVQKQLNDHLNISIELSIAPHAQITEKSMVGNYDLLRLAWAADYPSPENFLWMFYGKNVPKNPEEKSFPNILRYTNPKFDELYEKALKAQTTEEALVIFMQAEQLLMKDAPVLALWYDEGYRLLQSYVKNFPNNAMQYRDFSEVYIDKSNYKSKEGAAPAETEAPVK